MLWLCGVEPASAFESAGHKAIEQRALGILQERYTAALAAALTLPPTRQDIIREVYMLPNWTEATDAVPAPRSQYPDASGERQFAQDLQGYHFMAGNKSVVRAANMANLDAAAKQHVLLLQTLPDCLQLMRFLLWEACYNPEGASESGRGVFVLLHIVADSYSSEHTTRDGKFGALKAVKGWRLSRPAWPLAAHQATSEGTHRMLHGGIGHAPGDEEWFDPTRLHNMSPQAEEAANALADVMTLFYRTRLAQQQFRPLWDASLSTYARPGTSAADLVELRDALTHTYYQSVHYGEPAWEYNSKGLSKDNDYPQLDPAGYPSSQAALLTAFRNARPVYDALETQLEQGWRTVLNDHFRPFGNATLTATAFAYVGASEQIVHKEVGDYIFHYPPKRLRVPTATGAAPGPVNSKDAFAYDYHTSYTVLGFGQWGSNRSSAAVGGELQYHCSPGPADAKNGLLHRSEYGVAVAVKSVPYRNESDDIDRCLQTNVLFAPNLFPLPYLNAAVQGRIGGGITTNSGHGLVTGVDLAWNIGAEDAHYPLRVVIGYEHNAGSLPMPDVFSLKIGFNNWHTRMPW
ncbi:hypothetical protein [Hymenobacter cheonanensis]|uniref:hypothetical protein n=1 Tax=Hymenobacter sp. CA2-7 TaxID=3063993 RepID=UPI00272BED65|nr:hypothetical protein [Hymenobacter sp. CA2-7]